MQAYRSPLSIRSSDLACRGGPIDMANFLRSHPFHLSDSAIISPKSDQLITREPNQIQLTKLPSEIFHSWDPSFFYNKKNTHPVGKKSKKKKKRPKVLLPDFHQIALDRPAEFGPELDLRV